MLEIGIVGGGLAGMLMAEALLARGCRPAWLLDSADPLRASAAPGTLMHAFPGRSFQPHPLLPEAFSVSLATVRRWMEEEPGLVRELPIVRPLEGRSGRRLRSSYDREWSDRKEQWAGFEWLDAEGLSQKFPGSNCSLGAVVCRPAFAVELGRLLEVRLERAEATGMVRAKGRAVRLERRQAGWEVHLEDGRCLAARCVVLCLGAGMPAWFPGAGLELLGGELVRLQTERPLDCIFSINGLHALPRPSGELVFGASRWLPGEEGPADGAFRKLAARFSDLLPGQPPSPLIGGWRGVRCVHPRGKLPLAGPVPGLPGLFVVGGFGGKGLLWGPLAAAGSADSILAGGMVPAEIGAARIVGGWSSPRIHVD
jgi:glycine/D-amino acid oxidase-like deaminating enzyme